MRKIISIKNGVARMPEWRMAEPVNFELNDNEHIAVIGPNGGGKSMLMDIVTGRHPIAFPAPEYDFYPYQKRLVSDNIRYITFRDSYGEHDGSYYLQQRWNQQEIDEDTPTARQILDETYRMTGGDTGERRHKRCHLYDVFGMEPLLDKYVILLSSGEMRKLVLVRALLSEPRVLIMDNPFIGLDTGTRRQLSELLGTVSKEQALQIILVISKTSDIPDFITHVVEVRDMTMMPKMTYSEYLRKSSGGMPQNVLSNEKRLEIRDMPYRNGEYYNSNVVIMDKVSIRYGDRTILKDIDWTVRNGERWALGGQNGAGKSTLLSLICADNPQGYACNITLFDRQRGSGESIWEIKRHIGYVSPEMHRAYRHDIPAIQIVASGLKDSMGLYARPDAGEYDTCRRWMGIFGLEGLEERPFLKLSSGQQRLVLLARAFVKDPQLLILDEPFHGLDDNNRQMVREIIEEFCLRRNKTMIIVCHYDEELPRCISNRMYLKRI